MLGRRIAQQVLVRGPSLPTARGTRHFCSVDDSLKAALRSVAERMQQADPSAVVQTTPGQAATEAEIPGVRTPGPKMILRFTCTHGECGKEEEERITTRIISKKSYEQGEHCLWNCTIAVHLPRTIAADHRHDASFGAGIVCVRCECDHQHLIADNLGWFGDTVNIEQMLAERGEEVRRILVEDPEGLHLDPSSGSENR